MVAATTAVLDDPYQVLNVPHTTATPEEIKQSYRILAKKYHPDTWSATCFTPEEKEHATTIFQKVAAAYELLTDPIQKSMYDRNYKLGMYDHTDKQKKKKKNNTNTTDDCRGTPHNSNNENSTGRGTSSSSSSSNPRQHSQSNDSDSPPRRNTPPIGIPPPLPKGWITTKDYKSGQLYYYHPKSGRSSWNHPALCSNTSEYNANNNNTTNNNTPNMNTNFNFNGKRQQQQQGKGNGPTMSGGDFPFNRRTEHSNNEHIFNNDYAAYNENNTNKHQKSNNNSYYDPNYDETIYAGGRKIIVDDEPDTHRCGAFMALVLCPPLGIFAAYNSIMVTICLNRASEITTNGLPPLDIDKDDETTPHNKKKKQEELALAHSNLAGISTCVGNIIGIIFWVCYSLFREDSDFEWPKEWSFEEWFDDK